MNCSYFQNQCLLFLCISDTNLAWNIESAQQMWEENQKEGKIDVLGARRADALWLTSTEDSLGCFLDETFCPCASRLSIIPAEALQATPLSALTLLSPFSLCSTTWAIQTAWMRIHIVCLLLFRGFNIAMNKTKSQVLCILHSSWGQQTKRKKWI